MTDPDMTLRSLAHSLANKYAHIEGVANQIRRDVLANGTHEIDAENLVGVLEKHAMALRAYALLARGAEGPYEQAIDALFDLGPRYFKLRKVPS